MKFAWIVKLLTILSVAGFLFADIAAAAQSAPTVHTAHSKPDLNGIWQVLNEANWNLEPHIAAQGALESLGAIGAQAPGTGVVVGGRIPYRPEGIQQRRKNFADRRTEDPEAKCFLPGVPRATYLPYPFQIVQSDTDIMFLYQFAGAVRTINMERPAAAPVDSWMGWSNGHWQGNTLVVEVTGLNANWLDRSGNFATESRRVTERYTLTDRDHMLYEATIEDPSVFTMPWTIRMPLYRRVEPDARLLDFRCVEFAEELMYGKLRKPGTGSTTTEGTGRP
jgi:hypothetical protein